MGMMNILDRTGHTKHEWNSDVPFEVDVARDVFNKAIREGYTVFDVGEDGKKGERMKTFDPAAESLLVIPQLVGG